MAFPGFETMIDARSDGWWQRAGIDRLVVLKSTKTIAIDEKVRTRAYSDFCLEYWSSVEERKPGWVAQELACDYIAYSFVETRVCFLLPFQQLRRAWRENALQWVKRYRRVDAANHGYTTRSVAVPIKIVLDSLSDACLVQWSACHA